MAENRALNGIDLHHVKEAICVDTNRVYDSCADKDCIADLRVYFTDCAQGVIENATAVRARSAEILNCVIEVEKVPFNKGCYSVDLTFFVKVCLDAISCPTAPPTTVEGLVSFGKKCILYGSEGNVKIFTSNYVPGGNDDQNPIGNSNPTAKVQSVDPIILDAKICRVCDCCNTLGESCEAVPNNICRCFTGTFCFNCEKGVKVTLGIFTIVQLERDVQMLIPAYDFCIPTQECSCDTEDPCDTFKRICFPIDEFFPPNSKNDSCATPFNPNSGCGCGCSK